ncbi:hypothetical protein [Treponema phagedenis]|uniref:hypothetical protein n=1 Tax=Treponema phagedenis TaxID=162 RepID=UPI00197E536C|nr:hypothetical protein [Treponema phagedenis]
MEKIDIAKLKQEAENLGILNIEASGELTPAYLDDAIKAVKRINVDIDALATKAKEK